MLTVENLHFRIGPTKILNGVDLVVNEGEQLGIIGPNGCGKTTLFNCLGGFYVPSKGTITYNGQNITETAPHIRSRMGIGRVFQNFGIFKEMSVLENVVTAIESTRRPGIFPWSKATASIRDEAFHHLELVGLAGKSTDKAGSLSGGQMRLLEIIRLIAFGAQLLLLDEPTAGVSPKMKHEITQLLHKLQELKKTVMIIEHDISFIQTLCDRVVVLDVGQVVLDGTPERVRNDTRLHEIYFGSGNGTKNGTSASAANP